eukprot:5411351-Pyramimonas_sp.AAC.1
MPNLPFGPALLPDLTSAVAPGTSHAAVPTLTILHNTSGYHVIPAYLAELRRARARAALGLPNEAAILTARSHPLPLTAHQNLQIQTVLTVLAAVFVLVPFCYLAATFAIFTVAERESKVHTLNS